MKKQIGTIILVSLIVAIVVSVATVLIMQAIATQPSLAPSPYITRAEVNTLMSKVNPNVLSMLGKCVVTSTPSTDCDVVCKSNKRVCTSSIGIVTTGSANSSEIISVPMQCNGTLSGMKIEEALKTLNVHDVDALCNCCSP